MENMGNMFKRSSTSSNTNIFASADLMGSTVSSGVASCEHLGFIDDRIAPNDDLGDVDGGVGCPLRMECFFLGGIDMI